MPYTFGSDATTKVSFDLTQAVGLATHSQLVMGWYRPTTLTAGRVLWSAHLNLRAEIDTTTDELRLRSSHGTTNGEWTTTGVDMTVDQWYFIAVLFNLQNTPSAQSWHAWRGTPTTRPAKVTVTQVTAPSGNLATTGNVVTIGNVNTDDKSFIGDIAEFYFVSTADNAAGAAGYFQVGTASAISETDANNIYRRLIQRYYFGLPMLRPVGPASTTVKQNNVVFHAGIRAHRRYGDSAFGEFLFSPVISGQTGQFIRPESFVSSTDWTGAVTTIDEETLDDADFVYSTNNVAAVLEVAMTNPGSAAGLEPTVRYRHAKTNAGAVDGGGNAVTVTGELFDGATLLASDSAQSTSGTWTTRTWQPSLSGAINWDDVRVKLTTTASGGSPANRRGCGISWVEIEWVAKASPTVSQTSHPRRPRAQRFGYPMALDT